MGLHIEIELVHTKPPEGVVRADRRPHQALAVADGQRFVGWLELLLAMQSLVAHEQAQSVDLT